MRRVAVSATTRQPPAPEDATEDDESAAHRIRQQTLWVDLQVKQAMARGEFDNLPGAGKPIPGLDGKQPHDPDWWVKRLVEREQITGVLPPALALRKEDAELDAVLDREPVEDAVRRLVEDFNRRVVEARRQLQGGPPVITPTRDVDAEVARWRARRQERLSRHRVDLAATGAPDGQERRPRWWRRRR